MWPEDSTSSSCISVWKGWLAFSISILLILVFKASVSLVSDTSSVCSTSSSSSLEDDDSHSYNLTSICQLSGTTRCCSSQLLFLNIGIISFNRESTNILAKSYVGIIASCRFAVFTSFPLTYESRIRTRFIRIFLIRKCPFTNVTDPCSLLTSASLIEDEFACFVSSMISQFTSRFYFRLLFDLYQLLFL